MEVVARYKQADVAWKVGRIMLKYRPIAPKPASSCASSGGGAGAGVAALEASRTTRGKRKSSAKGCKRGRKSAKREECSVGAITTLPLMPETPERKEEPTPAAPTTSSDTASPTVSFEGHAPAPPCFPDAPTWQVVAPTPVRPVGSWVTVEKVTDTWRSGEPVLWDEEAVRRILERDTCPAFVSDELETVTWTNSAYKKMVVGTAAAATAEEEEEEVVRVALVSKSGMVPEGVTCFTCRVRVRYACRSRRGTMSMAAPCDVWRLAEGKLVWRLDVKAALSLGLGC